MDYMGEVYQNFQSICTALGNQVQEIFLNPIFWVLVFLLLCSIVLAYSGASQGRLASSIVGTLRQLGTFLIDSLNSIINACRSLFGFLDVLKLLFFGHLGHSTLYVLTNYAIIFLSMASFATTLQGLSSLIGWTGILVSFGVQVMELVTTMGIIICWVPPKGKLRENVTYIPCCLRGDSPCERPAGASACQQEDEEERETEETQKISIWKKIRRMFPAWGMLRRITLLLLLLAAYLSSSVFSYCYIFNAVVMPEIAYDDYMESIDLVIQSTEAFELELTAYRTELVRNLIQLNSDITSVHGLDENGFSTLAARIQSTQNLLDVWNGIVSDRRETLQQMAQDDPDRTVINDAYLNAVSQRDSVAAELASLRGAESSADYAIFTAIELLERYYADPLYLVRNGGDIEDNVADAFSTVITQGLSPFQEEIGASLDGVRIAFNNYTNLCRYYAEHGETGLNLSQAAAGADSVQELLDRRADILDEYSRRKNQTQSQNGASEENTAETESASDYLNGETGRLLIAAMQALEDTPRFMTVGRIWPGSNTAVQEPSTAGYLTELNQKYRASNGQLSLQERAFTKLSSPNPKVARFCLTIALILDGMIIALCCVRGREYYANNTRNRRQMIAMLFVIAFTGEERARNEQGRRRALAGTVLGCFVYLLYFRLLPGGEGSTSIAAFVLIIGGIMLMTLLGVLRDLFQKKALGGGRQEDASPVAERLTAQARELFGKQLKCGCFWKKCVVRRPKTAVVKAGANYYKEEKEIWKKKEDHRIRPYILGYQDYDDIVTVWEKRTEFYVLEKTIVQNENMLSLLFAILISYGLAYRVWVPEAPSGTRKEDPLEPTLEPAYLLTRDFIRLLYECIMLRTITGNSWEYGMEDDLLDYEREDDDEKE